jgi:hypothetical protein
MAKSPAPRNARSTRKAARPRVWRGNHGSAVIAPATRRLTAVRQLASPPRIDRPRRIHPRRFPPRVPEGEEQIVRARLLPIARMAARAVSPGDELTITRSTELTGPGAKSTASNVGEPSVAVNGDVVLYTGNWYAAVSVDGGKTFRFLDPSTAFARFDPPGSSFCCDQVAQYIPSLDTFVWLLQYSTGDEIDNFQRLAFAKTSDVAKGRWRLFDITAAHLGVAGTFLDFPDLAIGAGALYMTTNVFPPRSQQVGTAVVRIPFTSIANGPFKIDRFVNFSHQSFRVAQNCGATAFFAAHESTSSLRVFSWKESQAMPISKTVGVARWIGGDGYRSKTPDRRRWLDRADSRITGATLAGSELWFGWGVDQGSSRRKNPFVQVARIDSTTMRLVEDVQLFDDDAATCYPAMATNADGDVGIAYFLGGGTRFPTLMVGVLTDPKRVLEAATSGRGPLHEGDGRFHWGDYLAVRPLHPGGRLFAASGYVMKGGGDGNGSNRDCTPRFVVFGRKKHAGRARPTRPPRTPRGRRRAGGGVP